MESSLNKTAQWYIFYCASRSEKKLFDTLTVRGFEVFVPLVIKISQWSDRKKKVQVPLIPGYIFVKVEEKNVSKVLQYTHVVAALKMEGKNAFISEKQKSELEQIVASGYAANALPGRIEKGDKVTIEHGPFKGMEGVFEKEAGEDVFLIHIDAMNHIVKVKIPSLLVAKKE